MHSKSSTSRMYLTCYTHFCHLCSLCRSSDTSQIHQIHSACTFFVCIYFCLENIWAERVSRMCNGKAILRDFYQLKSNKSLLCVHGVGNLNIIEYLFCKTWGLLNFSKETFYLGEEAGKNKPLFFPSLMQKECWAVLTIREQLGGTISLTTKCKSA